MSLDLFPLETLFSAHLQFCCESYDVTQKYGLISLTTNDHVSMCHCFSKKSSHIQQVTFKPSKRIRLMSMSDLIKTSHILNNHFPFFDEKIASLSILRRLASFVAFSTIILDKYASQDNLLSSSILEFSKQTFGSGRMHLLTNSSKELLVPEFNEYFTKELYYSHKSSSRHIFQKMRKSFGIRISEVIYGLLLVDKAVRNAPLESKFRVTLDTLSMSIVVGVMLSHKISTDKPFSNESWAHIFNASLSDVASSEIVLLKALNFDVSLDEKEMKFLELFLDK